MAFLPLIIFCAVAAISLLVPAYISIIERRRAQPPPRRQIGFHPVVIQGGKPPSRDAA